MLGYRMPTHVQIAPGCRERLPEVLRALQVRSPLLVVDPGLEATRWPGEIRQILRSAGLQAQLFNDIAPNPRTSSVAAATEILREQKLDGVIGLGGGSVLDTAKAAAMLAKNEGHIEQYEGKNRYLHAPLPFVALPTTCGTGSEVTWVSVLSHEATRTKISVKGETMFPNQALVDADMLATLPRHLIAFTGVDALTHAVEAAICSVANPVSDALSEKAIALLLRYLPDAFSDPHGNELARNEVMRASTLAGLSFSNADVGGVHCLSESLGGMYDVHHGLANAVLLAPVLRYHREAASQRLAELELMLDPGAADASGSELAERFIARVEALCKQVEVPPFSSLGMPEEDLDAVSDRAFRNGSNGSNPQRMTAQDYRSILESLFAGS